jgi:peptidoglycan hydrolase-like protein with peptidoglycan-binding domain
MPLKSNLFAGDARLEACAASNPDHVTPGATGPHVRKIQGAVMTLDGANIDQGELDTARYGPSTAAAVLAYKTKRDIVNRTYQSQADDIVGIMTIKALDAELLANQVEVVPQMRNKCPRNCGCRAQAAKSLVADALAGAAQLGARPAIAAMRDLGPGPGAPA